MKRLSTLALEVNKVDESGSSLYGAEFELYKVLYSEHGGGGCDWGDNYVKIADLTADDGSNTVTYKGLGRGAYMLKESKAPGGYDAIEPIYFFVTAEGDVESDDPDISIVDVTGDMAYFEDEDASASYISEYEYRLSYGRKVPNWAYGYEDDDYDYEVYGEGPGIVTYGGGTTASTFFKGGDYANPGFEFDPDTGVLSIDVVNEIGREMPETGGLGVLWLYACGAMAAAGGMAFAVGNRKKLK